MRTVLPVVDPADPRPRLGELPDPEPEPGEVRIAVRAAGLNRADLLQLRGLYPPPPGESEVPGLECSGVIDAVGPEATRGGADGDGKATRPPRWKPGDRVMALLAGGGLGERVVAPAGQVMPLPADLSFVEGAALPEAGLTAWTNLVFEGGLAAGETVVVTGANGGIGTFAVQLADALGGRVLAAGRDLARLEPLRELGADELVVLGPGLPDRVRALTGGRGADLVVDLVGGEHLPLLLASLAVRGRLVLVGLMAGARAELDLGAVLRRRLRLIGSVLRGRSRAEKTGLVAAFAGFALPLLADGRLRPVVDRTFSFDRVAGAFAAFEAGGTAGKIVVEM